MWSSIPAAAADGQVAPHRGPWPPRGVREDRPVGARLPPGGGADAAPLAVDEYCACLLGYI